MPGDLNYTIKENSHCFIKKIRVVAKDQTREVSEEATVITQEDR